MAKGVSQPPDSALAPRSPVTAPRPDLQAQDEASTLETARLRLT